MKSAAKRLATTSSSEASVWRRAAFFELRRKALLIFESADEAVRCAVDEAFGAKFKSGRPYRHGPRASGKRRRSSLRVGTARHEKGARAVVARGVFRPSAARRRGGEDRVGRLSGGGAFGAREASVLGRLVAKCDV